MELTVKQQNLAKALNIVSRIANMKTQMAILDNILLRTEGNRLLIASTNLEIATTERIGAKIIKTGDITIPAKVVTEFINNLPDSVINLKVENNRLIIKSENYNSTINGVVADDFPELPTIDETTAVKYIISTEDYKKSVSQILISVSNDLARPVLNGVLWQSHNGVLNLASTDGYRLSEKKLIKTKSDISTIVPSLTMQEVMRAISEEDEEIEVLFSATQVRFRVGETEIISQLIDGNFPDYRQLIPKDDDVIVKIRRADFMQVAKVASLFAVHSASGVTINVDETKNSFSLRSIASEIGENISEAEAEIKGSGKTTLNSRYLIDALNAVAGDEIIFEFKSKLAPCLLKSSQENTDYIHIIMPLKS